MKKNCNCCGRNISEAKYEGYLCRNCKLSLELLELHITKSLMKMKSLTILEILHKHVIDRINNCFTSMSEKPSQKRTKENV